MFNLTITTINDIDCLNCGFPKVVSPKPETIAYARKRLDEIFGTDKYGGRLLLINGSMNINIALMIGAYLQYYYGAIAIFDPQSQKYVVSWSESPDYQIGQEVKI